MKAKTDVDCAPVEPIVMPDLPTRFRAVMWDAHWQFDAPCVLYLPFMRFGFGGNSGRIDSIVEDICIDIAIGQPVDATAMRADLEKECEWRGWSVRGISRRKDAWHVQWDVRWWRDDADELQFEMMNRVEQRGPFKADNYVLHSKPNKGRTMKAKTDVDRDSAASHCYAALRSFFRNSPPVTLQWLESQDWLHLQPGGDAFCRVYKCGNLELQWHGATATVKESIALYVQVAWITSHPKVAQVEHLRAVLDA